MTVEALGPEPYNDGTLHVWPCESCGLSESDCQHRHRGHGIFCCPDCEHPITRGPTP